MAGGGHGEHCGVLFQPMAGRPASLELAPEADDVDPVDEAEHDEVDEALLADDPEDEDLPDEVEVATGDRILPCLAWARVEAQTSSKSLNNQKSS